VQAWFLPLLLFHFRFIFTITVISSRSDTTTLFPLVLEPSVAAKDEHDSRLMKNVH